MRPPPRSFREELDEFNVSLRHLRRLLRKEFAFAVQSVRDFARWLTKGPRKRA